MALLDNIRRGKHFKKGSLISTSTNTSGAWMSPEGMHPFSITVSGDFSATSVVVTIYVDDGDSAPSDADANHATLKVFTITAPQAAPPAFTLDAPFEWIKAVTTSYAGTQPVTVNFEASEANSRY